MRCCMSLNKLLAAPLLGLLLAVTACGPTCKSVCEDSKKCTGADKNTNCGQECDNGERITDNAKCGDQYETYFDCEGDKADVCRADDHTCDAKRNARPKRLGEKLSVLAKKRGAPAKTFTSSVRLTEGCVRPRLISAKLRLS